MGAKVIVLSRKADVRSLSINARTDVLDPEISIIAMQRRTINGYRLVFSATPSSAQEQFLVFNTNETATIAKFSTTDQSVTTCAADCSKKLACTGFVVQRAQDLFTCFILRTLDAVTSTLPSYCYSALSFDPGLERLILRL